nr:hypothetical protein 3 [bacterium]
MVELLFWFLFWFFAAWAVMVFAVKRDRSGPAWFFLSLFLTPVLTLLFLLALGPAGKRCPACAETVREAARTCRYCGHQFPAGPSAEEWEAARQRHLGN